MNDYRGICIGITMFASDTLNLFCLPIVHVCYSVTRVRRRGAVGCTSDTQCGGRGFEPPLKPPVISLSKKLYPYCLVLVGSTNGFERDFTIEVE